MKTLHNKIPPPFIAIFFGLLMWLISLKLPLRQIDFAGSFYIACMLIAIGLYLDINSFFNFRKSNTTINPLSPEKASKLVVKGFYRVTRNPMYLGMLLILTGVAMFFGNLSSFLVLPLFVLVINILQIKPEEEALTKLFGIEYEVYMSSVRRWL